MEIQKLQKQQNINLLSDNLQQANDPNLNQTKNQQEKQIPSNKQISQAIDPIEQLLKNKNIMPLLAIIDRVDLKRTIQQKPLISIMATKFIPLQIILKNREIQFTLDADKKSPLHYAIEANDVKAAAWLMQKGNPNNQDNFGNTPILDAIRLGRPQCFLLCLKNKYYDERAPILAAMHNRFWQLSVLYGMNIDIFHYRDQQHKTSFDRALQYCSFQCAQFMIKIRPQINIQKHKNNTQSKGLIRRLKRIQKQESKNTEIKNFFNPLLILFLLSIGITGDYLKINGSFPYETTAPLYLLIIFIIVALTGLKCVFGSLCKGSSQYRQKNTLAQILNEPNYQTIEQICPICMHFTNYRYQHCFKCGCCVQKYHFHSFVCVNKSNQVFWIISQFIWLYLVASILNQFNNFIVFNYVNLATFSSYSPMKFIALIENLIQNQNYICIFWEIFLVFLFLHQVFYCVSIFGMMCMRRKFQEVIHSQKYHHLYKVVKDQDHYMLQQQKIFQRGLLAGLIRCARNFIIYFFTQD